MLHCCRHDHYAGTPEGDRGFEVDATRVRFGRGLLEETGEAARSLGLRRVAFLSDAAVAKLPFAERVRDALKAAGVEFAEYNEIAIEPTDASFLHAIAFATEGKFDGYISLGGGSTIDTAKAANLYATHPTADFMDYVNAPIGGGKPIPGPLTPHIACPTTSGTGSECTGMAIFDYLAMKAKTGISQRALKPSLGIIDPDVTRTLPSGVVACTAFDVLSHALESFTAQPYTRRKRGSIGDPRPLSQGANPFSDIACLEALRMLGTYIVRAVNDAHDEEAREQMMFAATLAGIGFGNAGCHLPHGMSYAVSGLADDLVPHGMSVIVNSPSVFRFIGSSCPERHLQAAEALGADVSGANLDAAGDVLATRIVELMRATGMPNGLSGLGYDNSDLGALADGSFPQKRLISNAPVAISRGELEELFGRALAYW
jgi:hydroxyacid-oxoacid transhydrogenase